MAGPRDDSIIFDDISQRLLGTGLFADTAVAIGYEPDEIEIGADRTVAAWIQRSGWTEEPAAAEYLTERTVTYTLTVSVRNADYNIGYRYLNEIESAILNVLNRESYAGATYPTFSRITRGRDQPMKDREQRVVYEGMFRYQFTDDRTDHDVSVPNS